ncbi:MAG: hypothetical protein [Caudoviricetes sp.]|nr:MAG: hypothetical protein [Caudoviricetes sp.]
MIENKIVMLTDKEHIIRRPGMYIGSTVKEDHERFVYGQFKTISYVPGLITLFDEILANSIDEAIRTDFKFANQISIEVKNNKITVEDNGRGIPQDAVLTPEGEELPGPVAAWTRPKAGGNFGDDNDRKTGGMNGVGSSLTNIFSTSFVGVTSDGKTELTVNCTNGADNVSWTEKKSKHQGTKVTFIPDFDHFDVFTLSENDLSIIEDKIQTFSVVYPQIAFKFNGKKVQGNFKKYAKQFDEHAIVIDEEKYSIAIGRSPEGFRQLSYVNNIQTKNAGSHIDYVIDEITAELIPSIKRKHKIEVNKARIKECLTLVMFVRDMSNMRFDSQTKDRLTSPAGEIKKHIDLDAKKVAKSLMNCEEVLMPIIEAALARKLAADAAAATKAQKKAKQAKVAKHIKANEVDNPNRKNKTILFLTEGDSAMGYLSKVGDPDYQGGYPLRGKTLNVWKKKATIAKILENKELFDIMAITGLQIGKKATMQYYDQIAIMTDADHDGVGSIFPGLTSFFFKFWPELYKEKRIMFVKTPVIIVPNKKGDHWFYSIPEFEKWKENKKFDEPRYIKGLGSLTEAEYAKVLGEPVYDVIEMDDNAEELFITLYGDESQLRKDWLSIDLTS